MQLHLEDAHKTLLIDALCCVIASDGRVSGREVTVVMDTLASIGVRMPLEDVRRLVVARCRQIYADGAGQIVTNVARSLRPYQGSAFGELVLTAQDRVLRADGRETAAEHYVAARFMDALRGDAVRGSNDAKASPPSVPWRVTAFAAGKHFSSSMGSVTTSLISRIGVLTLCLLMLGSAGLITQGGCGDGNRIFKEHGPDRRVPDRRVNDLTRPDFVEGKAQRMTTSKGASLSIHLESRSDNWDMTESEAREIVSFVKKHQNTPPPIIPKDVLNDSYVLFIGTTTMVERSLDSTLWSWTRNGDKLVVGTAEDVFGYLEVLLADLDKLAAARRPAVP